MRSSIFLSKRFEPVIEISGNYCINTIRETCQRLIESMPRRVQSVIKVKGGHTKY
jgi:hypothetical protein